MKIHSIYLSFALVCVSSSLFAADFSDVADRAKRGVQAFMTKEEKRQQKAANPNKENTTKSSFGDCKSKTEKRRTLRDEINAAINEAVLSSMRRK